MNKVNLLTLFYRVCHLKKTSILTQTFQTIFPFILCLSVVQVMSQSFFSDLGFLKSILQPETWFPFYHFVGQWVVQLSLFMTTFLGCVTAYFCAVFTLEHYHLKHQFIGIFAILFYLLCHVQINFDWETSTSFFSENAVITASNIVLGLFVGRFVGYMDYMTETKFSLCKWFRNQQENTLNTLQLILSILVTSLLLKGLFMELGNLHTYSLVFGSLMTVISQLPDYLGTLLTTFLTTIVSWLGINPTFFQQFIDDNKTIENLNMVLTGTSLYKVPNMWTMATLYQSYGRLGGDGNILAALSAIILFGKQQRLKQISFLSLLPSVFGSELVALLGLPVSYHMIYVIPFLVTPLLNEILASLAIVLKLIPSAVYPVPIGTPGFLTAFMATGGHVMVLTLVLFIFVIDIACYYPFMKWHEKKIASWEGS